MEIGLIGILVVVGLVVFVVATYNALVQTRNRVSEAESQIDVQLRRRLDLIPNLVEAVKGQMGFESGTLERITAARAGLVAGGHGITTEIIEKTENVTKYQNSL